MLSRTRFILLAVLSLTAAACGLKGPLYRPDEPQAETPSTSSSETAPKKKDPASVSPPDPDRPAVPPDR